MRLWLLIIFCGFVFRSYAQNKPSTPNGGQVEGIVFDKDTKDRVARTNITNTTSGKSFYNNFKGEFKVDAKRGDKLVFTREDYLPDTLIVKDTASMAVSLQRLAIPLREVTIRDTLVTPLQRLYAKRKEFSKAYGSSAYDEFLGTSPGGGAGISIDALWNSISREGRNAKHLQGIIQSDYQQDMINYRFNRSYVGNITKLKDQELTDFMIKYRPGYYTVTTASEYEFITYIRNNLRRYLRNKKIYTLPPLNVNKGQTPD
ncbi:MAG TPA: hypothetical protein VGM63_07615 [Mucilaginibacter sp.]